MRPIQLILVALTTVAGLSGCGTKTPLSLPPPSPASAAVAPSPTPAGAIDSINKSASEPRQ